LLIDVSALLPRALLQDLVFGSAEAPLAVGVLANPDKPLLFTMARLDRVKNLTGLVEW
jgi:sucrose synthase